MSVPEPVIQARANICRACPTPCPERDTIDLSSPCAACPIARWHEFDCSAPCAAEPPVPSLGRRVVNFAVQSAKEAGAIVLGARPPSADEVARRMSICQTNVCGQYRADGRCAACGCPMAAKSPWRSAKCPRGQW
jgi:hypothetical protein